MAPEARAQTWHVCGMPSTGIRTAPATSAPTATEAPTASLSVTITSLPASVAHGANATMTAQTSPGASCNPTVTYASGTASNSTTLVAKPSNGSGDVSWTWKVGPNTGPGTSYASVTCTLNGVSGTDTKTFDVT